MVIVAAVDRSERATSVRREAERLAESLGETVHVVHVLSRGEFVSMGISAAEHPGESISMDEIRAAATDIATEHAAEIDGDAEAFGLVGDPAKEIIRHADQHDARYIVVAPRKRSPTGKALFGSEAQQILLNAEMPVVSTMQ